MEETIEEQSETSKTSGEETGSESKKEEQETSEKPERTSSEEDLREKAHPDRLYARMKKAEERAKQLEEQLKKSKTPASVPTDDVVTLAKTVAALKDYTPEELDRISVIAKGRGVSLVEAAQTEEAKLLIAAMREKVAKSKSVPNPSAPMGRGETTPSSLREIQDDGEFEAKLKELDKQANEESRKRARADFDYPIFMAEAEKVGITATGETGDNVPNELPKILKRFKAFKKDPQKFVENLKNEK